MNPEQYKKATHLTYRIDLVSGCLETLHDAIVYRKGLEMPSRDEVYEHPLGSVYMEDIPNPGVNIKIMDSRRSFLKFVPISEKTFATIEKMVVKDLESQLIQLRQEFSEL